MKSHINQLKVWEELRLLDSWTAEGYRKQQTQRQLDVVRAESPNASPQISGKASAVSPDASSMHTSPHTPPLAATPSTGSHSCEGNICLQARWWARPNTPAGIRAFFKTIDPKTGALKTEGKATSDDQGEVRFDLVRPIRNFKIHLEGPLPGRLLRVERSTDYPEDRPLEVDDAEQGHVYVGK